MKGKNRFPVVALALIAIFSLVTAPVFAGGSGDKGSSGSSGSGGKTEITYMAWYNTTESEAADTQKVIDKYNASQNKVHVKLVSVAYNEYITKLNTMAAANQLPDTALMNENMVIRWAVAGKLADVSNMYSGDNKPLDSLAFRYKGKPVAYSTANEVLVLYYNKKLFDAAGVPYPPASADKAWTWQQFVDAAKKLTKDRNGKTPNDAGFDEKNIVTYGADYNRISWMWPVAAISNGGGLISQDGKQLLLGKPETIEAAQAIADLYLVHKVAPSMGAKASLPNLDVSLLTGKVAMATSGQWEIGVSLKNSLKDGLDYGVAVLPKFKTAVTYNTGGPQVIFGTTKNMAAAQDFIKWYTDEDNNLGLIQGGIWMPVSKKWYVTPALIEKWAKTDVHPPLAQYKTAVIDYAMNNAQQVPWYFFPGYDRIDEALNSGMDAVWNGRKTAKDAILNDILPKIQQIFDENAPK